MEVEARVSVQAMRGRFEQLHEESPSANSPTQKINTSPVRTRTTSVISKDTPKCDKETKTQKLVHTTEMDEPDQNLMISSIKNGEVKDPKNDSLSKIISPVLLSLEMTMDVSQRKHSVDSQAQRRYQSEKRPFGMHSRGLLNKSAGEMLDNCGAEIKPSVVRRIPVFKSVDTGLNSENTFSKEEEKVDDSITECHEKRGRFFGHIRSRSHGSFIIKRDQSVEKKSDSIIKQKESILNKDWLSQKKKVKSSDHLLNNQDSKSNSTFEGKQKIVANVVKNMKNKERSKVFRKLSFSSKFEKEIKNKKEKSVTPGSKDRRNGLIPSPDKADNFQVKAETNAKDSKIDRGHKRNIDNKQRSNGHKSGASLGTVSVAKAVADATRKLSGTVASDTVQSISSSCSGNTFAVPPARPPRRRSSGAGLTHKKGKAPSPPSQPSPSPVSGNKTMCDKYVVNTYNTDDFLHSSCISNTEMSLEHRLSPDFIANRCRESPDLSKSSESLLSSHSFEKTRENSPIITDSSSPSLSKRCAIARSPLPNSMNDQIKSEYAGKSIAFRSELQSVQLENKEIDVSTKNHMSEKQCIATSRATEFLREKGTNDSLLEATESEKSECLPAGPPPRKPPRTFAYDIYKNVKTPKSEEDTGELNENSKSSTPPPQPIYAVPLKKKKNTKTFSPKPPVRSKSDLTNKDISKPSIAPKPAHIITKAKRASMVDPLSSTEKDEEAAITSEFQRQAHIRYSLRRPKKPPPAPPPYTEMEGNINYYANNPSIPDIMTKLHADRRCSLNEQIHRHIILPGFKNVWDVNSNHQEIYDNENNLRELLDLKTSHSKSLSSSQGFLTNDYEDIKSCTAAVRATSSCDFKEASSPSLDSDQPLSLGYCSVDKSSTDVAYLYKKRSMSDETLYKGSRRGDEPIYATPFTHTKGSFTQDHQRELHYMESDAGRDGNECGRRNRRNSTHCKERMLGNDVSDGNRGRSSLISAWKRDFRQSCRQVQNKIKKTVIR